MRTPRREAGRLINQTVTLRTITLARHSRTGTTASLLPLSTPIEPTEFRVPAHRMCRRLTPEKTQQRITLLAQASQPLSPAAGVLSGNDPDVTRQRLAVAKPFRIAQKDIGRQGRDRSYAGMRHQQPGGGSLACLLQDLLIQLFDLRFEPGIHRLQLTAPLRGVCCQRQRRDRPLSAFAPQRTPSP